MLVFFFLKDPAPPDISPLPLHDPLPIASLPPTFGVTDEFYTFRTNPRDVAHILLRADPVSLETEGDLPLAWTKPYGAGRVDRKSTRLNSSHANISYAVFCLKKKTSSLLA